MLNGIRLKKLRAILRRGYPNEICMGQLATASCSCGYDQPTRLGGVRSNHLSVFGFPYVCHECKAVFTGNLFESSSSCMHCKSTDTSSYEQRSLRQPNDASDRSVVYSGSMFLGDEDTPEPLQERPKGLLAKLWRQVFPINVKPIRNAKTRDVTLQQGGYLCPRCDGFNLCFGATGMID